MSGLERDRRVHWIDGVFFGKGRLYSTSFFDVDRMEFIKGSQSTLLGKNASFGAISVITRQPGDAFSVEARGGYEFENGGYTVDGAADLPLGDAVSLRVAGHYNDLDGQVRGFLDMIASGRGCLNIRCGQKRARASRARALPC